MDVGIDNSQLSRALVVPNEMGLHVRAARLFYNTANQFRAAVTVRKGDLEIDGKSIFDVLTLGAVQGDKLDITVAGDDAHDAMGAIVALFDANFHES